MELSINPKNFSDSFVRFWNFDLILNILEKKMIVIATLFRKLENVKDLVRPLLKNTVSENPLTLNMLKGTKILQNLHEGTFVIFFFMTLRETDSEIVSLSDMLTLTGVS